MARPLQALFDREIEQKRKLGRKITGHRLIKRFKPGGRDSLSVALIGKGRIGEAVA